jgi:5'-nucleotidase
LAYSVEDKLVLAVSSSALFDLTESHAVYLDKGVDAYRSHQREREDTPLTPGTAFPLVKRLLALNDGTDDGRLVEVILLSRNDADSGLRVFKSAKHHGLDIRRGAFMQGDDPWRYIEPFDASLFLSKNEDDVKDAVEANTPAGRVLDSGFVDDDSEMGLRLAFDFDKVLVNEESEEVFEKETFEAYQDHEATKAEIPHSPGPLKRFFAEIAKVKQELADDDGNSPVSISIVTARDLSVAERTVKTLRSWGVEVDKSFYLGGVEKSRVLKELKPHIFFDDSMGNLSGASEYVPSVHIPFDGKSSIGEKKK